MPPDLCVLQLAGCHGRATHTHHRKLRRHGDERPVNLMRVCADCHQEIHANPAESYEMGWMVHSWDDPAEVPCEVVPR